MLRCILKHKTQFTMDQYDDVTAISYNAATKVVTITYGSSNTTSYDLNLWILNIISI